MNEGIIEVVLKLISQDKYEEAAKFCDACYNYTKEVQKQEPEELYYICKYDNLGNCMPERSDYISLSKAEELVKEFSHLNPKYRYKICKYEKCNL